MRILIADDTEIIRLFLAETLQAAGHQVVLACDGLEALQAASCTEFELLILDQRMPCLFGSEVLKRLRHNTDAASQRCPAIAISSEMDAELAGSLFAAGFCAALGKPVRVEEVLGALESHHEGLARVQRLSSGSSHTLASAPRFDDAQALRALGRMELVPKLRGLLAVELRSRETELTAAVVAADAVRVRELIHQSLASCAMCGTPRLEVLLRGLRDRVIAGNWINAQLALRQVLEEMAGLQLELVPPAA